MVKAQVREHSGFFLGSVQIVCAHGHQVGFDFRAFRHHPAAQLGGGKALDNILAFVAAGIQSIFHGGQGFVICIGVDNDAVVRAGITAPRSGEGCDGNEQSGGQDFCESIHQAGFLSVFFDKAFRISLTARLVARMSRDKTKICSKSPKC